MTEQIKPELVSRMEALVRSIAEERQSFEPKAPGSWFGLTTALGDEARAIVAELPAPADSTKAIVDDVIADLRDRGWLSASSYEHVAREASYAAIKRVRAGA